MMLDCLNAEGGGDMRLPGSRASYQHHILSRVHELASMKLADQGLTDFAGGKVEAREILVCREACCLHVIGDGTHLTFSHFGL